MSNTNRRGRVDKQLDQLLDNLSLSDEARLLIETWRNGEPLDETNAEEARRFTLELMRTVRKISAVDVEFDKQTLGELRSAKLNDWRLVFPEAILRRIPDDPQDAVTLIAHRDEDLSEQNSINGRSSRNGRRDWWSVQIEDCLDSNIHASIDDVIKYLIETGEVQLEGKTLRHIRNEADRISRAQVRSRMEAAKKRIQRES